MRKIFWVWIFSFSLSAAAAVLPFDSLDLVTEQMVNENQQLKIDIKNLPLQIHIAEILDETDQTTESLLEFVTKFRDQISESQYLRILSLYMNADNRKTVKKITDIAVSRLASFAIRDGETYCRSYIFQALVSFDLKKELNQIASSVDHPVCDLQLSLLENAAFNNQRPTDELWQKLIDKAIKETRVEKREQAFYFLAEEMINYEAWEKLRDILPHIQDPENLFIIYEMYFDHIDQAQEIPKDIHDDIVMAFKKDIQEKGHLRLREAALALQSAGQISQLQELMSQNLDDADDRLKLRLVKGFAESKARLYAQNALSHIQDVFVKAKAMVYLVQFLGTQPLAGDDPYLEQTLMLVNKITDPLQRDDIYQSLVDVALDSGAADTALTLTQKIKNQEIQYKAFTKLAITFAETGNEQAAKQIIQYFLPPALNHNILPKEDYRYWLDVMAVFSPAEAIQSQLQIMGGNIDDNLQQVIDILINDGLYSKAEELIAFIENPWVMADAYLYLATFSPNKEQLVQQATSLLSQNLMVNASPYLESIVTNLMALNQRDLVQQLYDHTVTPAERLSILGALMLLLSDQDEYDEGDEELVG